MSHPLWIPSGIAAPKVQGWLGGMRRRRVRYPKCGNQSPHRLHGRNTHAEDPSPYSCASTIHHPHPAGKLRTMSSHDRSLSPDGSTRALHCAPLLCTSMFQTQGLPLCPSWACPYFVRSSYDLESHAQAAPLPFFEQPNGAIFH